MPSQDTSREQILYLLKTRGGLLASELAEGLGVTPVAIREQLGLLEAQGLVEAREERRPRGRPARRWQLCAAAAAHFPESYGELALDLLGGAREAFGEAGVQRLIEARGRRQLESYRAQMPPCAQPLAKRIAALVKLRTREGYMARWRRRGARGFVLIENNCPICAIAQVCQGVCGAELELFRALLGPRVQVERSEHLLAGERRCVYRIQATD